MIRKKSSGSKELSTKKNWPVILIISVCVGGLIGGAISWFLFRTEKTVPSPRWEIDEILAAEEAALTPSTGQEPEEDTGLTVDFPEPERKQPPSAPAPFINPGGGAIALTFDDGPMPGTTERLLDILSINGVKATFFVLGSRAARYPDIIQRMASQGHQVASHTMNHYDLTAISDATALYEINESYNILTNITGAPPTALRAPYGNANDRVVGLLGGRMRLAKWNIDPRDWEYLNASVVYSNVVSRMRDGGVIILHDIYNTTVDAVQGIIDAARANGYTFCTIDEMFALGKF